MLGSERGKNEMKMKNKSAVQELKEIKEREAKRKRDLNESLSILTFVIFLIFGFCMAIVLGIGTSLLVFTATAQIVQSLMTGFLICSCFSCIWLLLILPFLGVKFTKNERPS